MKKSTSQSWLHCSGHLCCHSVGGKLPLNSCFDHTHIYRSGVNGLLESIQQY